MTLLGEIPGGKTDEADLHRRFRTFRVRGEWFRYSDELRSFVEEIVAAKGVDTAVPYCLFDGDSDFLGLFSDFAGDSDTLVRAYVQAHRAVLWSSVGQWWRFGCDWEEGTNPVGFDPAERYKPAQQSGAKITFCTLRDAGAFQVRDKALALQQLLRKAKEFRR
jgi:hypothetical protein